MKTLLLMEATLKAENEVRKASLSVYMRNECKFVHVHLSLQCLF